jgi:hypothetical protein
VAKVGTYVKLAIPAVSKSAAQVVTLISSSLVKRKVMTFVSFYLNGAPTFVGVSIQPGFHFLQVGNERSSIKTTY